MFSVHLCHNFNLYLHIHRRTICAMQQFITSQTVGVSSCSDLVLEGIRAAATLVSPVDNESTIFSAIMNKIMTLHVDTVSHIPRSVRPLLTQVLAMGTSPCLF